jgi:hypothetical protein
MFLTFRLQVGLRRKTESTEIKKYENTEARKSKHIQISKSFNLPKAFGTKFNLPKAFGTIIQNLLLSQSLRRYADNTEKLASL